MLAPARALALAVPAALLAGAWAFQLLGGLYPCEMCHWQRWPHYGAVVVALLAILSRGSPASRRPLTILAGLLIVASGLIGLFHAGVEYHWWQGLTRCSTLGTATTLKDILATPLIRCDAAQWTLWGVSLAGWNALFSLAGGIAVLVLATKRAR